MFYFVSDNKVVAAASSQPIVISDNTDPVSDMPLPEQSTSQPVSGGKRSSVPSGVPRTTLVICPLSVLSNWEVCGYSSGADWEFFSEDNVLEKYICKRTKAFISGQA